MARSLFIQNSERPAVIRAQLRRLKDELRGSGLLLEGPFQDQSEAVAQLCADVNSRMKWGASGDVIPAAIATLAPQNVPSSERSWLKVPFVVTPDGGGHCESAGSVANAEPCEQDSRQVRAVDMEGLTLLGVAVLRKLGVPSFFSYMHFDQDNPKLQMLRSLSFMAGSVPVGDPSPLILAMNPEPEFLSFLPPYALSLPTNASVMGFEVLDDLAVQSLVRLKMAYENCISLMCDVATRLPASVNEGVLRAAGIGHTLHEGVSLWSEEQARQDLDSAIRMLNPKSGSLGIEGVRLWAERQYVHNILCPVHHGVLASEVMLGDEVRQLFSDIIERASHERTGGVFAIPVSLSDIAGIPRLAAYLSFSEVIREHVHERRDCPVTRSMN